MINKKSETLWKNRPGKVFQLYNPKYMNGTVPRAVSIKYMLFSLLVWYSLFRSVSFSSPRNRSINPKKAISDSVVSVFFGSVCSACVVVSMLMKFVMYFPVASVISENVCDVSKWHDSS